MSEPHSIATSAAERAELLALYPAMLRIRRVEETIAALHAAGEIPGFVHTCVGQEAVAVALGAALAAHDTLTLTHRGHGHALAKGMALDGLLAELLARDTGVCRGRSGSMHLADFSRGVLGANGIVAGGLSIAAGSALAHQLDGHGAIAVGCFGDGAMAEGLLHECFNVAALWRLPCLFLCENNGWSEYSPSSAQVRVTLGALAAAFGIEYRVADGSDVLALARLMRECVAGLRAGARPLVLECNVTRVHGHHAGDTQAYRDDAERAALVARDPLLRARDRLVAAGVDDDTFATFDAVVADEIAAALAAARAAPAPAFAAAAAAVYRGVYA